MCYKETMKEKVKKNIVAIIPARGGSKAIPNKNIKKICGKPLIAWAIEAALKSKVAERIIVSTDNKAIARVAKKYGAEVPFLRPRQLAEDSTAIEPVLKHAIEWLKKNEGYKTDVIVLLLPTNPLRNEKHIDEAVELFLKSSVDSVISSSEVPANHNPAWVFRQPENKSQVLINALGQEIKNTPIQRQQLPKFYTKNDIVFVLRPENLYETPSSFFGSKQKLYIMDDFFDADINTLLEWTEMEKKLKRKHT